MNRVAAAPAPRRFGGTFTATATVVALAVVPVVVAVLFLGVHYEGDTLAFDLRGAYLPAAEAIADGESPYPELHDPRLAAERAYVYPPLLAVALTPATLLSENAASVLAALVSLALVLGMLYLLGLRDWRCYGAAILWAPSLIGAQTASASLLVAFLVALAWIYRERPAPFAASLGLAIAVKLFVWPLVAWSLAMGRLRAAVTAARRSRRRDPAALGGARLRGPRRATPRSSSGSRRSSRSRATRSSRSRPQSGCPASSARCSRC